MSEGEKSSNVTAPNTTTEKAPAGNKIIIYACAVVVLLYLLYIAYKRFKKNQKCEDQDADDLEVCKNGYNLRAELAKLEKMQSEILSKLSNQY